MAASFCQGGTCGSAGALTVTDNKAGGSQTYTTPTNGGPKYQSGAGGQLAYVCNSASAVTQLTFTWTGSPTLIDVFFVEYNGMNVACFDQAASATGISTAFDSGAAAATTNATDVLVGFGSQGGGTPPFTAGNDGQGDNYTALDSATFIGSTSEDFFTTAATAAYKATMTSSTSSGWLMLHASFKGTAPAVASPIGWAVNFLATPNCTSTGGTCGAAPAGAVTIAAAATTVTVSTTAVTANSDIIVQENSALGTRLSVTCNITTGRTYTVTTITGGTSFVITASAAPTTNPACLHYFVVN